MQCLNPRNMGRMFDPCTSQYKDMSGVGCRLRLVELSFLEHLVSREGTKPLLDKVQAILEIKEPKAIKDLGLINFYRSLLPHVAGLVCRSTVILCTL
ncbi:hypothetical protein CDAR_319571 [Caerostris darwini]|uniref:Uncharacterized protein n=1 Tax=Caerostris darwini TaxID=1538125 RepID=A0AAV4V8S5_9ARAC|nr:hypothetical protein CDAR_319571 [Caerostris darwini]